MKNLVEFYQKHKIFADGLLILTVSVMLRLLLGDRILSRDSVFYCNLAEAWHENDFFPQNLIAQPGVIYLYKIMFACGLPVVKSAVFYNLLLSFFLPVLIYMIAMKCFQDNLIAIWSGILMAFNPFLLEISWQTMRDSTYLFWGGIAIYTICCYPWKNKTLGILFFSLASTFSMLARHEGLELFVLLLLVYIWKCRRFVIKWSEIIVDIVISVMIFSIFLIAFHWMIGELDFYLVLVRRILVGILNYV